MRISNGERKRVCNPYQNSTYSSDDDASFTLCSVDQYRVLPGRFCRRVDELARIDYNQKGRWHVTEIIRMHGRRSPISWEDLTIDLSMCLRIVCRIIEHETGTILHCYCLLLHLHSDLDFLDRASSIRHTCFMKISERFSGTSAQDIFFLP